VCVGLRLFACACACACLRVLWCCVALRVCVVLVCIRKDLSNLRAKLAELAQSYFVAVNKLVNSMLRAPQKG
jgi:hypothetical protein